MNPETSARKTKTWGIHAVGADRLVETLDELIAVLLVEKAARHEQRRAVATFLGLPAAEAMSARLRAQAEAFVDQP